MNFQVKESRVEMLSTLSFLLSLQFSLFLSLLLFFLLPFLFLFLDLLMQKMLREEKHLNMSLEECFFLMDGITMCVNCVEKERGGEREEERGREKERKRRRGREREKGEKERKSHKKRVTKVVGVELDFSLFSFSFFLSPLLPALIRSQVEEMTEGGGEERVT